MDWYKSYLSAPEQVVSIGNCLSCPKPISVGVAQGSILGPLLLIIYDSDLPQCLRHCKIILYADDTPIFYSAKTAQDVEIYLNIDLLVKVWENSKKLWKHSPAARVPTAFLVLPNFHSCFYNSIETRHMFSISKK